MTYFLQNTPDAPRNYPTKACNFGCRLCRQAFWLVQKGVSMSKGAVKWFDPQKGFGFIALDGGGQDAFVHSSAVERAGIAQLREGDRVAFELVSHHGGDISAEKLEILS